ncbi:MAG: transcriptional regulator Crp/Fnr family [Clostridiales bacterium]|jgi:CRP/FNR family transcriptional regulator|nr:transcriptional regulator Crp/Fnr family [Clostridiales bacterium]
MLRNNEITFVNTHLNFWDKLNTNEKNLVISNTSLITYNKGFNLYSADTDCLGVLIIKSGELRTYILSEDGREVTLYRLTEGNTCVLSASCILNSITFDVHIDAECDSEVFLLNISTFSKLCSQNVYVENFAYKTSIERFSDVMWAMEQILFMSFDKRLAIFLIDEMSKTNTAEISLTQEQIAKYIGSAREVVSRMLKTFQSEGMVELSRGSIRITNKEKLKKLL